jgi:hypothetical protein
MAKRSTFSNGGVCLRRLFKGGRLETDRGAMPEVSHRGLHAGPDNAKSAPEHKLIP